LRQQKFQLGGAIIVAALLPLLVWVITGTPSHIGDYGKTTLTVCLAIVLSHLFVQELARYPGESPLSATLPSVTAAFGIVVVGITFTHAHYSRGLLLSAYVLTVLWYAVTVSAKGRYLRQ
jgi:phosphatidylserine synthase